MKSLRHFYLSKNPLFRAIAGALDINRTVVRLSNFGLDMGSLGRRLGNHFPQAVRVNRHHRKRFANMIVKPFRSHCYEFCGWFGYPAQIECLK